MSLTLIYHIVDAAFSVVLGKQKFPQTHTAAHLAEAKHLLIQEWGIKEKVRDQ